MDIAAFRVRITIQKKGTITDRYGNHLSVWNKWFSCWAYASDQTGQEEEAVAQTVERDRMDFTVRYCSETDAVAPGGYRIILKGRIYDMAQKVSIDEMADAIMEGLEEYAELAADEVKKAVRKTGRSVRDQISQTAPRRTGAYANSWAVKKTGETSQSLQVTVHSRNRYQIAHLLEHGHAKRGGGRVRAIPHIAPAEAAGEEQLTQDIMRGLQNG